MIITYDYDPLYRLTSATYSDGRSFGYQYDAVGNALQYTQNLGGSAVTTTYNYNNANQLTTAQMDNSPIVWEYAYDPNGRLTDILPDGIATNGAKQYTYNTAGYLTQTQAHDGSAYQLQAEMLYDGLGQRLNMTGYALGTSITTNYALDPMQYSRPLTATSGGNATVYFYGIDPIAEFTTDWSYSLPDGTGTPRQLTDANGEITLAGRYTPWGDSLDYVGTGNFTFGYFGGLMDSATGLLYIGNGQYYDPQTGRFLTRDVQSGEINPYVPWGNPTGALFAPLALVGLIYGRKKKKSKFDYFVIVLFVIVGVGMGLSACGPAPMPPSPTPLPPPTIPPSPSPSSEPSSIPTPTGKTIYLTFDDGPDPYAYTFEIASVLNSRNVKATFFLTAADQGGGFNGADFIRLNLTCVDIVGNRNIPNANPDLLQVHAINAMGHAIGLHGLYHVGWNTQLDHGLYQLTEEERLLNQLGITLSEPVMVRAPFLGWGKVPIPGYKSAYYYETDIVSNDDKENLSAEGIVNSITSQLQNRGYPNGPIILLHSTNTVNTYKTIINPSPDIDLISKLQELGYTRFEVLPRPGDTTNKIIGTH